MKRENKRVGAFTLIEVLVVLSIIGIVMSFVAPMVLDRPDQARSLKLKADFEAISAALGMYRLDVGKYPDDGDGLEILFNGPTRYLASAPIDPWGQSYQYRRSPSGEIVLISAGPDGAYQAGSGDDISFTVTR